MKKRSFIVLLVLMITAFVALVWVQVDYYEHTTSLAEEYFTESAIRSIYQTAGFCEEKEALMYLTNTMGEFSPELQAQLDSLNAQIALTALPAGLSSPKSETQTSMEKTINLLQGELNKDFSRSRTIFDKAVFRWLRDTKDMELQERVNFDEFYLVLGTHLEANGIDEPYEFEILNADGKQLYRSARVIDKRRVRNPTVVIQRRIFEKDRNISQTWIRLCFPTMHTRGIAGIKLFWPSLVLIMLVLGIFVFTAYTIIKQRNINEMKNDFINNMTHEFKTPIASISLAAQMLSDDNIEKTPAKTRAMLRVIGDESKRLSLQVEKILQIAIFERENSMLHLTDLSINDMLREICKNFELKITGKGGQISLQLNATNDIALVDDVHFTNVIYNLLDNALKYAADRPLLVSVTTSNTKDGNLQISIEDNGIGIRKEDQKRVFEKFFRVHTGNRHDVKGFGLGLAYVQRMVEEHHGTIHLESELGIGSRFTIQIPTLQEI